MALEATDTTGTPAHDLQVLGANLYRRRTQRIPRMSQVDLAEKADVAVNVIRKIEAFRDPARVTMALATEDSWTTLRTIAKLADALDCTVTDLLDHGTFEASRVKLHGVPSRPPVRGMPPRPVQSPLVLSVPDGG